MRRSPGTREAAVELRLGVGLRRAVVDEALELVGVGVELGEVGVLPRPAGSAASLCSCRTTVFQTCEATLPRRSQAAFAVLRNWPRRVAALRAEIETS